MQSIQSILINRSIQYIDNRYNGDRDIIPGASVVTWADKELVEIIKRLVIVVEDLQDQISAIRGY